MWTVYVVRCRDGSLYVGITNDLAKRLAAHNAGRGGRYTRSRRPVEVVFTRRVRSETTARRLEVALKKLDRPRRLRLVAGDAAVLREALRDVKEMARKAAGKRELSGFAQADEQVGGLVSRGHAHRTTQRA